MPSQGLGSTTGLELTVRLERLICPGDFLSAHNAFYVLHYMYVRMQISLLKCDLVVKGGPQ